MKKEDFKTAFEKIAKDVEDNSFEITGIEFPLKTLITPNEFFVQFSTFLNLAGQGFNPGSPKKFYPFLNQLNQSTNLAKLTVEGSEDGSWTVLAKTMIASGQEDSEYTHEQLDNLLTLWHQDIASIIATESGYEITGMLVG